MKTLRAVGVLSAVALCAAALISVTGAEVGPNADANKALVQAMYDDAINRRDVVELGKFLTEDFVSHDPDGQDVGRETFVWGASLFFVAFPDSHVEVLDLVAEGDRVAARWLFTGTHTQRLESLPATGAKVELSGISIHRIDHRIDGGRIAETWEASNTLLFLQQLGVIPTE